MPKIVFKDKNKVVILKPSGISSQPDNTFGEEALTLTERMLSEQGEEGKLYPIHRLDKVVSGLLVFARNRRCAGELSSLVSEGELNKEYLAVVEGKPCGSVMKDHLMKNSLTGKAVTAEEGKTGAKYAELQYEVIETVTSPKGEKSLVRIKLKTGRFHQIRAQFSSRGYPLIGDKKYGSSDHRAKTPALFAFKLNIESEGECITIRELPSAKEYPWNLFNAEIYKEV